MVGGVELVASAVFGAGLAAVSMPLWRLAGRNQGPAKAQAPTLPEVALEVAQAFGGYAMAVTPTYKLIYVSAEADTLPAFDGTSLAHPYLKALVDEAWTEMDAVVRRSTFTTLGPIQQAEVRAARVADRYVLITIADRTEFARTRDIRHDFIANIGHELRTPITAVDVIASTLEAAAEDPDTVRHFSGRLRSEAHRLARLTQDVLALARAQDADPTQFGPVDMVDAVEAAVDRQRTAAEAKSIKLRWRIHDQAAVWGDKEALITAVENLVSNAINYSPDGSAVDVALSASQALREVVINVADHGIGIDPVDQERVFERFYRADQARSRRTGGTGLGLAIVRNAVAGHGGNVALRSKPGVGSVFTVRLPLYQPKET
jgi:two-component system sensor histidine kinase SenX3